MSLRPVIVLVLLALQLCACTVDPGKKAAIDQMEQRHAVMVETGGGGGGGGGGM
jgi:hypothetical protein